MISRDVTLITVIDGHPSTLSWIGSIYGHKVLSLGVDEFGQSGDTDDLYKYSKIDSLTIMDCLAKVLTRN